MREIEELAESFVNEADSFVIGSIDEEGYPNIKAVSAPRKREELRKFSFLTRMTSKRVQHYTKNPKASLYFCKAGAITGLMIKGYMTVIYDPALIDELWREGDEEYYPEGDELPDCAVLMFTGQFGHYFDGMETEIFTIGLS